MACELNEEGGKRFLFERKNHNYKDVQLSTSIFRRARINMEAASPVSTEMENKLSRKPAIQDRRISNLITATKQLIEQVQMHTDISAALTNAG